MNCVFLIAYGFKEEATCSDKAVSVHQQQGRVPAGGGSLSEGRWFRDCANIYRKEEEVKLF